MWTAGPASECHLGGSDGLPFATRVLCRTADHLFGGGLPGGVGSGCWNAGVSLLREGVGRDRSGAFGFCWVRLSEHQPPPIVDLPCGFGHGGLVDDAFVKVVRCWSLAVSCPSRVWVRRAAATRSRPSCRFGGRLGVSDYLFLEPIVLRSGRFNSPRPIVGCVLFPHGSILWARPSGQVRRLTILRGPDCQTRSGYAVFARDSPLRLAAGWFTGSFTFGWRGQRADITGILEVVVIIYGGRDPRCLMGGSETIGFDRGHWKSHLVYWAKGSGAGRSVVWPSGGDCSLGP